MKNTFPAILIATALFCSFLLGSCKKNADLSRAISYVSVNNADVISLNFTIGEEPVSNSPIPRGISTGYVGVYEGSWNVVASFLDASNTKLEKTLELKGNEYTSIFVINPDTMQFFTITDDLSQRDPNRAKIKFLNLSPDAQSLSLEMRLLNTSKSFDNVKYKSYSDYQDFDEKSTYSILLKNAADDELVLELDENFEKGKLYTIWTTGSLVSTAPANSIALHITEVR